jgi:hypothetical protein
MRPRLAPGPGRRHRAAVHRQAEGGPPTPRPAGGRRAYQRQFGVPYPLANDASGRTWAAWGAPYQPVTVVVDGRGRVARRFDGEVTPGQLRPVLAYLLDE